MSMIHQKQLLHKYLKKIDSLRSGCETYGHLTRLINQEFKKNFHRKTIYYQVKKLKEQALGKPSDDAKKLLEMLADDASERGSFYVIQHEDLEFRGCCFASKRMIANAIKFSDVIVVDTSHSTNRFNLPLLDIAIINNLGKTITSFVSLLPNQKYESFFWALK